jgi:hypothetical protein
VLSILDLARELDPSFEPIQHVELDRHLWDISVI